MASLYYYDYFNNCVKIYKDLEIKMFNLKKNKKKYFRLFSIGIDKLQIIVYEITSNQYPKS